MTVECTKKHVHSKETQTKHSYFIS